MYITLPFDWQWPQSGIGNDDSIKTMANKRAVGRYLAEEERKTESLTRLSMFATSLKTSTTRIWPIVTQDCNYHRFVEPSTLVEIHGYKISRNDGVERRRFSPHTFTKANTMASTVLSSNSGNGVHRGANSRSFRPLRHTLVDRIYRKGTC